MSTPRAWVRCCGCVPRKRNGARTTQHVGNTQAAVSQHAAVVLAVLRAVPSRIGVVLRVVSQWRSVSGGR